MKRFVLFLFLVGCGGDKPAAMMMAATSSSSNNQAAQAAAAARAAAPGKCEAFVGAMCGRLADCAYAADPSFARSDYYTECQSAARTAVDCGAAIGVSSSYDRCIRDLSAATCTSLDADIPAACQGCIIVP